MLYCRRDAPRRQLFEWLRASRRGRESFHSGPEYRYLLQCRIRYCFLIPSRWRPRCPRASRARRCGHSGPRIAGDRRRGRGARRGKKRLPINERACSSAEKNPNAAKLAATPEHLQKCPSSGSHLRIRLVPPFGCGAGRSRARPWRRYRIMGLRRPGSVVRNAYCSKR